MENKIETPFLRQKEENEKTNRIRPNFGRLIGPTRWESGFYRLIYTVWCCSGCCCSIFTGFCLGHRQKSRIKWAFLIWFVFAIVVAALNIINFLFNVIRKFLKFFLWNFNDIIPLAAIQEIDQQDMNQQIDSNAVMWVAIDVLSKQGKARPSKI